VTGGAVVLLRMVTAVALANFVTMTTRLSDMLAVFERLARPLAPILPPRRLALAFALVIRFIPVMLDRMGQIRQSWSARSPRPPRWRVMVPATLAALDDADRVAEALRARGGAG
jgi:biotin transport system permease protein